jgi:hypothetical protein
MPPITNKQSILCYGASDSGKSTQARYIATYIWEKYHKKTRLIALDRGSLWAPCQDLVDSGIVIPLEFPTSFEYNPMAIMRKLRRGEWPKDGIVNQPSIEIKRIGAQSKTFYHTNTAWTPWGQKEDETIGAIIVDSITTFATAFMSDTKQKNVRIGGDGGSQAREEDGETMGTNTQSHYGDAHTEVLDAIQSFQCLPVHITYFTALEGRGIEEDAGIRRPTLGPASVGRAINSVIPSRVNHCFHLVAEGTGAKKVIKAWYCKHPSSLANTQWPAKITLTPSALKSVWKAYPSGFIPLSLDRGISDFLSLISAPTEG